MPADGLLDIHLANGRQGPARRVKFAQVGLMNSVFFGGQEVSSRGRGAVLFTCGEVTPS